jgi:hypothetical protein
MSINPQLPEPKPKSFWAQVEDVLDDMYGRVWRLALLIAVVSIPVGAALAYVISSFRAEEPTRASVTHHGVRVVLMSVEVHESILYVDDPEPFEAEPGMAWLGVYLRMERTDELYTSFSLDQFTVLARDGRPYQAHAASMQEPGVVRIPENVKLDWNVGPPFALHDPIYVELVFQVEDVPHDVRLYWQDWAGGDNSPSITIPYPP